MGRVAFSNKEALEAMGIRQSLWTRIKFAWRVLFNREDYQD